MKVEGRNAVAEILKTDKTIDRLVVAKGLKDAGANNIINVARSKGVKINFYDREVLDRESVTGKHQGFIAEVTDFKYSTVDDIMDYASEKGEPPFIIILDGVEDPHNLGSVIRVAECAGCHGVIIPERRAACVNETVVKVSAGAAAHVKVARVNNINETIDGLKKRGVWVFCSETGGGSVYDANLTGSIAFVIGGEGTGVKRLTREKCDGIVTLPMFGKVNSLNASVAAGLVAYEYVRQNKCNKQ